MNTNEYVKQVADGKYPKMTNMQSLEVNEEFTGNEIRTVQRNDFTKGLTLGLELAEEFAEWCVGNYKRGGERWYPYATNGSYTTTELLEIFLTEKIKAK